MRKMLLYKTCFLIYYNIARKIFNVALYITLSINGNIVGKIVLIWKFQKTIETVRSMDLDIYFFDSSLLTSLSGFRNIVRFMMFGYGLDVVKMALNIANVRSSDILIEL